MSKSHKKGGGKHGEGLGNEGDCDAWGEIPKKNQLKYTKKERKKKTVIVKGKFIYANKFLHEKDKNLH